jgi:hypothetical protein
MHHVEETEDFFFRKRKQQICDDHHLEGQMIRVKQRWAKLTGRDF